MDASALLALLLVIGLCVALPIAGIVAGVIITSRKSRLRHEERMAMIARGLVPPESGPPPLPRSWERRRDPLRPIGWAVGLLVAGTLWVFTTHYFAAILLGAGSALLTRGLLGLRHHDDPSSGGNP
jgi:hypothetical protein